MNAAFYLIPKSNVSYLYGDITVKQGLEKMRATGYTAVPVIDRDGSYMGTISEGDFLWFLHDITRNGDRDPIEMGGSIQIKDIMNQNKYEPVHIDVSEQELINRVVTQNFVPVIDDRHSFIGIVTRRMIMSKMKEAHALGNID